MKDVTLIVPYYENPGMLSLQLQEWMTWPGAVRDHWRFVVVDDGSPSSPAVIPNSLPLNLQLYRIKVDVRWNWLAARNIGAHVATTDWLLLTDIDHVVPVDTAARMNRMHHDEQTVYRFSRVTAPEMHPYKPHPNSWFMTKKMFDRVGGYDERLSGYYGTDSLFREKLQQRAKEIVTQREHLVRVPREVQSDASTTKYERKTPEDRENVTLIRQEIALSPESHRLTFPWERVL